MDKKFQSLGTVEKVDTVTDEATVLIEENGDIKRVPTKEVGGGGKADAIINIAKGSQSIENDGLDASDITVELGSYDELLNIIINEKRMPKIIVNHYKYYDGSGWDCTAEKYECVTIHTDEYDARRKIMTLEYINSKSGVAEMKLQDNVITSYMIGHHDFEGHSVGPFFDNTVLY